MARDRRHRRRANCLAPNHHCSSRMFGRSKLSWRSTAGFATPPCQSRDRSNDDIIALSEVPLSDALQFEPQVTCVYSKTDHMADQAREVFANDIGRQVFSALVSEGGNPKEKQINVITPWELVKGTLA